MNKIEKSIYTGYNDSNNTKIHSGDKVQYDNASKIIAIIVWSDSLNNWILDYQDGTGFVRELENVINFGPSIKVVI